ncbi:MAG: hypothetical protein M0P14_05855 [Alkaliphilus sp.]|nr:hypothetical protein [Alkaliphilus sp.]
MASIVPKSTGMVYLEYRQKDKRYCGEKYNIDQPKKKLKMFKTILIRGNRGLIEIVSKRLGSGYRIVNE